jgi:hypothetical protein
MRQAMSDREWACVRARRNAEAERQRREASVATCVECGKRVFRHGGAGPFSDCYCIMRLRWSPARNL